MRPILLLLAGCVVFFLPANNATAQTATFTIPHDTVATTVLKILTPTDNITNVTGNNLSLTWHVTACDFPSDWLTGPAFGICDNYTCRGNIGGTLWNESSGSSVTSTYYANSSHDSTASFGLSLDLSSATTLGTHYVTINLTDNGSSFNKNITFLISKLVSTVSVPKVTNAEDKVILYPNPANNELNVVYDANADVKNIALYNIIGKVMSVYKVNGESANLNLENIPSGIYFVRLMNSHGNVVITRKFTKQ